MWRKIKVKFSNNKPKNAYETRRNFIAKLLACTSGTAIWCLLIISNISLAQNNTEENTGPQWYEIEVIIFERSTPQSQLENKEEWPKNIILGYPNNPMHLLTEEEFQTKRQHTLQSREYENRDANSEFTSQDENNTSAVDLNHSATDINNRSTDITTVNEQQEQPFILLDKKQRQLNADAQRINRKHDLRVLFHEAWRQPIEQESSNNVLILGGNTFDQHYELEGTLNIRLNRYLHVSSNLWLSRFAANYGQESLHWPPLPEIPQDLPIEQAGHDESIINNLTIENRKNVFSDTLGSRGTRSIVQSYNDDEQSNSNKYANWSLQTQSPDNPYWQSVNTTNTFTELQKSAYLIEEIVLMQQSRRMRSEELHYIDHPKMGIVVQITPYNRENLNVSEGY